MSSIKKFIDEGIENIEKGAIQQVKTTVSAVAGQAGVGANNSQPVAGDVGTSEAGQQQIQQSTPQSDQATKEEVAGFYAPTHPDEKHRLSVGAKKQSEFFEKQIKEGKMPEEAAKIEAIRNQLHKTDYYDPLVNRKPVEEEHKEEKKEKEEEKMEELQVEDKKKKQDDDIALRQAQQKTEKFPGASG